MPVQALKMLVDLDRDWIPEDEESALYIRPFMFATDEVINLRREGVSVVLTGVFHPSVTLPADPFVLALYRAGERFLSLAATIWPEAGEPLSELREYAEVVRAFLPKDTRS